MYGCPCVCVCMCASVLIARYASANIGPRVKLTVQQNTPNSRCEFKCQVDLLQFNVIFMHVFDEYCYEAGCRINTRKALKAVLCFSKITLTPTMVDKLNANELFLFIKMTRNVVHTSEKRADRSRRTTKLN